MCDHCRRHSVKRGAIRGSSSKRCANSTQLAARRGPARRASSTTARSFERPVRRSRHRPGRSRSRRRPRPGSSAARTASWNSLARADLAEVVFIHRGLLSTSSARAPARLEPALEQAPRLDAQPGAAPRPPADGDRRGAHQVRIAAAGPERLAVEVDMAVVVEHAACAGRATSAAVERRRRAAARTRSRAWARSAPRRGRAGGPARRPSSAADRRVGEALQRGRNARRRDGRRLAPVGVERIAGTSGDGRVVVVARVERGIGQPLQGIGGEAGAAGARKPIEAVMHSPSATPSWPQPGGR